MARFRDYQDRHNMGGQPIPWLKVAGEALTGWVRENNPDYYIDDEFKSSNGPVVKIKENE